MGKEELEILKKEYKKNTAILFINFKEKLDKLTSEFIYELNKIKDR